MSHQGNNCRLKEFRNGVLSVIFGSEKAGENCIMRNFMIRTHQILFQLSSLGCGDGQSMKKKFVQVLGGNTLRKETIWKTYA